MKVGQVVLVVYALLMLVGGVIGYRAAGSTSSLAAGLGSAVLLAVAWAISRSHPAEGFWTGATVAAGLSILFAYRLLKTGKPMPSGGLLALSLLALFLLAWSAMRSGRA
jgi:uncharacterized membrane protein (UPF0136 family)